MYLADYGTSCVPRSDNGTECTNKKFNEHNNNEKIRKNTQLQTFLVSPSDTIELYMKKPGAA